MKNLVRKFWEAKLDKAQLLALQHQLEVESKFLEQELKTEYERMLAAKDMTTHIEKVRAEMILKNLHEKMSIDVQMPHVNRKRFQILKWAASIAIVFSVSVAIYYLNKKSDTQKLDVVAVTDIKKNYANTGNEIMCISLPDGSLAMLYPESSLEHNPDYGQKYRNIDLKGKAEFIVQKDKKHPFTVSANNVHTTALGTVFTVNSLVTEVVNVKLQSGKVVVRSQDVKGNNLNDVYLLPGEQLTVNRITGKLLKESDQNDVISAPKVNNAKHSELDFNRTSLADVFDVLSKKYNKTIEFNNAELDSILFTGTFSRSEELSNIISIVCEMNNLTFMENKSKITIQKK